VVLLKTCAKIAYTVFTLVAAGVFAWLALTFRGLPELSPFFFIYVTFCLATAGSIWFTRLSPSNPVFIISNFVLAILLWIADWQSWHTVVSVLVAAVAGMLLAVQPVLGLWLDDKAAARRELQQKRPPRIAPS